MSRTNHSAQDPVPDGVTRREFLGAMLTSSIFAGVADPFSVLDARDSGSRRHPGGAIPGMGEASGAARVRPERAESGTVPDGYPVTAANVD